MTESEHKPIIFCGLLSCSCGDYNCASLDIIRKPAK